MMAARNFAIYAATVLWSLLFWVTATVPVILLYLLLPKPRRRHYMRIVMLWFGRSIVRGVWRPFFRVRYEDRTGGSREPGIVVANHRAATDAFLVSEPGLSFAQTVNGWPMRLPLIGWGARLAGYLNITDWDYDTLRARAEEILNSGDMIVAFPEGTRSESRTMAPFRSGIFRVAVDLGLPVYMLCIAGNEYMPDRSFRFREFHDLSIRFLEPLPREEIRRCATAYVLKQKVFRRMTEELASMDAALGYENQV